MTIDRVKRIQEALSNAGLDWLFTEDEEERAQGLAEEFDDAESFYNARYQTKLSLLDKVQSDLQLYKPFLQSIGLPMSKEMRTVILRLLEGKEIQDLKFHYRKNGNSSLSVILNEEWPEEPIQAPNAWDVLLLPQLAYLVADNRVLLGGISPWNMPGDDEK